MGSFSWWHWLIVLLVVLLLFGGGKKIPELLKGLGTGIKGFKKAVREDEEESLDSSSSPVTPLASPAPKQASLEQAQAQQPQVVRVEVSAEQAPKKRGRPKGSTNKTESSKSTDSKKSAQSKKSSTKDSKATKATKSSKAAK